MLVTLMTMATVMVIHTRKSQKPLSTLPMNGQTAAQNYLLQQMVLTTATSPTTEAVILTSVVCFLHILGDCLASVGAMIAGLGMWLLPWHGRFYLDPILSVFISLIILSSSFPLVKTCAKILMQSVPPNVNLAEIEKELLKLEGVVSIHELHVWQLADTKVIGTVHLTCSSTITFFDLAMSVKKVLHSHGVHSTTIQPEYLEPEIIRKRALSKDSNSCTLLCESLSCRESMCCKPDSAIQRKPILSLTDV